MATAYLDGDVRLRGDGLGDAVALAAQQMRLLGALSAGGRLSTGLNRGGYDVPWGIHTSPPCVLDGGPPGESSSSRWRERNRPRGELEE